MGRGNFGNVLRVVWRELKKQVVKIRSKVDKLGFSGWFLLLLYITVQELCWSSVVISVKVNVI